MIGNVLLKWGEATPYGGLLPPWPPYNRSSERDLPYEQVISCFIIYKKTSQKFYEKSSEIFSQKKEVNHAPQILL